MLIYLDGLPSEKDIFDLAEELQPGRDAWEHGFDVRAVLVEVLVHVQGGLAQDDGSRRLGPQVVVPLQKLTATSCPATPGGGSHAAASRLRTNRCSSGREGHAQAGAA